MPTEKFTPNKEKELEAIAQLLDSATVIAEDIEAAIADWKEDPPVENFANLLISD
ncbi:MAG: hypothetical protein ACRC4J_00800 [Cetobacterium sp.]